MDDLLPPDFDTAAAELAQLAVKNDDAPNLLWAKPEDVVLAFRDSECAYFVWKGDPTERLRRARAEFQSAIAQNAGVSLEVKCKTPRWAICRLYVPVDALDAEFRMIRRPGVKKSVVVEPLQAVLVESELWWRVLKGLRRRAPPAWD